jgi:phosphoribosylglycinamide formyltransferase 1
VTRKIKTAALISGRGSNMAALVRAAQAPDYPATIALVLSNRADAAGLDFARRHAIATALVPSKGQTREAFDAALDAELRAHGVELIALAGFMRVLTPEFVAKWQGRMINIHPSLLPDFKGLDTHARALEAGRTEHGCTVHYVSAELDAGEIIARARVPVLAGDDAHTLAERVLEQEHKLYPNALADVARRLA